MENSKLFESDNKDQYKKFDLMLNKCVACEQPPCQGDEFFDFIQDWYDFKQTHKRSNRNKVLLRYRIEVQRQFQDHDHSTEWKPLSLATFHKTGRRLDETVTEMNHKIRELHGQDKNRPEIIADIRRLFPKRGNYPQDVSRVLGPVKPKK